MDTDAKNVDTQELYMWLMMPSSKTRSINILKKKMHLGIQEGFPEHF